MAQALFPPCAGSGLRLGLGGGPLGNLFAPVAAAEAMATIEAAWAGGCRSFDTAPHYGHGLSEHRFGSALRTRPRESYLLSSKVGRLLTPNPAAAPDQHGYVGVLPFDQHWDYSAGGVRRSLEDSLQRLGLARIDVAYVHDCDAATHGSHTAAVLHQVLSETLPALQRMKAEGLIGAIGLGANDVAVVLEVLREAELDALMLAGRYSLLDHSALPSLLPQCAPAACMWPWAGFSTPACWPAARMPPMPASTTPPPRASGSSAALASKRFASGMRCRCGRRHCSSHWPIRRWRS